MGSLDLKLRCRTSIFKLANVPPLPTSHPLWRLFWTEAGLASDVFDLLTPGEVRLVCQRSPGNVRVLVEVLAGRLEAVVAGPKVFGGRSDEHLHAQRETLNAVRVLTRLMPFMYEVGLAGETEVVGDVLAHMCSVPGFTLGKGESVWPQAVSDLSVSLEANRMEILRGLLAACLKPMYQRGSPVLPPLPVESLMNVVASSGDSAAVASWGTGAVAEMRNQTVVYAAQLLALLLVERPLATVPFLPLLAILTAPVLAPPASSFGILQSRTEPAAWLPEVVVVVWMALRNSNELTLAFAKSVAPTWVLALVYYIYTYRNVATQRSLVMVCAYMLGWLLSQPVVVLRLTAPMERGLYPQLPQAFRGTLVPVTTRDFVVTHLCGVLGEDISEPLGHVLVESLYNAVVPARSERPGKEITASSRSPLGGLSYHASTALTHMVLRLMPFLRFKLHALALVVKAMVAAILTAPRASRTLVFVVCRNISIYQEVRRGVEAWGGDPGDADDTDTGATEEAELVDFGVPEPAAPDQELLLSLRAQLPPGLSFRAWSKQPKQATGKASWPGSQDLDTLIAIATEVLDGVPQLRQHDSNSTLEVLGKIETWQHSAAAPVWVPATYPSSPESAWWTTRTVLARIHASGDIFRARGVWTAWLGEGEPKHRGWFGWGDQKVDYGEVAARTVAPSPWADTLVKTFVAEAPVDSRSWLRTGLEVLERVIRRISDLRVKRTVSSVSSMSEESTPASAPATPLAAYAPFQPVSPKVSR